MVARNYIYGIIFALLLVCLIAFAFLYSPISLTTPSVAWTPSSVTQVVQPGKTTSVSVSFTTAKNLDDVVVRVVPELKPYVQADPVAFGDVSKGETHNLKLTISVPINAQIAPLEGTVQLRKGESANKNHTKPLSVVINVVEGDENRVFEPVSGVSFVIPSKLNHWQRSGAIFVADPENNVAPLFMALPVVLEEDLSGLSHNEALTKVYEIMEEKDGIIRIVGFHSGGVELETMGLTRYQFYLYDRSSNTAIEFAAGSEDVFSSEAFQQIIQSVQF